VDLNKNSLTLVLICWKFLAEILELVSNLFISLFLAALMSFAAPVILIACIIVFFTMIGCVPGFLELSHQAQIYISEVLAIFGNGKPFQGIITLGITLSIVGVLFDILNFYRYQTLSDRDT
jgi:hypothetical protein